MSGPKCGGWRVVPAGQGMSLEEAQRLCAHYLECILEYKDRLIALQKKHPELQISYRIDSIDTTKEAAAADIARELNNRYEIYIRLRGEIERVESIIKSKTDAQVLLDHIVTRTRRRVGNSPSARSDSVKKYGAAASSILESIPANASAEQKAKIEGLLTRMTEAGDDSSAELYLSELRVQARILSRELVDKERREFVQREVDAQTARKLLEELSNLPVDLSDELQTHLIQVASLQSNLTDELELQAREAIKVGEEELASRVIKSSLEELGYEVTGGFETKSVGLNTIFFKNSAWGEHHVRIRLDGHRRDINFDVVRFGDPSAATDRQQMLKDREMEERWCGELPNILSKLEARQLKVSLTRKLPPGQVPVQCLPPERSQKRAATKDKRLERKLP